jgi:hypothetical protein
VRRALSTDPSIRAFLVDYMKNPPK